MENNKKTSQVAGTTREENISRKESRVKLTLRVSHELDIQTKNKAAYIGVSQNAFLAILIELGLRYYESNPVQLDG